mmetsp:Transcript_26624/g.50592  ORF Transcript_26624/g.50592 Transcript_26624/m.50592 type:complete len:119 (+) Transcript_26624:1241-1597(+)
MRSRRCAPAARTAPRGPQAWEEGALRLGTTSTTTTAWGWTCCLTGTFTRPRSLCFIQTPWGTSTSTLTSSATLWCAAGLGPGRRSRYMYGYPNVVFEVMKNGHLASVTLWKAEYPTFG